MPKKRKQHPSERRRQIVERVRSGRVAGGRGLQVQARTCAASGVLLVWNRLRATSVPP